MKNLLLFAVLVSLPLLLGGVGCGERPVAETKPVEEKVLEVKEKAKPEEPVAETKPVEELPLNPNLKYEIQDGTVTITDCDEGASGRLVIPATIEGKPVRTIGFGALANCVKVESITISKSVTQIETYAFQNCMNLFDIRIPDNVINIGFYAFSGCWKLEKITIGKGVKKIGDRAFNARGLKEVIFLGDAPEVGETPFNEVTVIYRKPKAKGWKDTFGGRPVKLISDKPADG